MAALLELENITKTFTQKRGGKRDVQAVAGVSLAVSKGETVGLVGESGCGKSTLARLALKLLNPTAGRILFDGADITGMSGRQMLPVRRRLQAVFQDPLASLNSRMTIAEIMREPFDTHGIRLGTGLPARIRELLSFVGMENTDIQKLPPQFSGGQLQRIAIARALALEPDIIVADEPTSALDPSIQAQIVNLLLFIQRKRKISYLIISHDLDVIGHVADRIAVMYLGTVIEQGPADQIMARPLHPYTQALLSAAPTLAARRQRGWKRIVLQGDPPNPANVPSGCRFHPRCHLARDICRLITPPLRAVEDGRLVACHLAPDGTAAIGVEIGRARKGEAAA
ncbi:oligopeptide/dipeptide ABC transporter ATP-binding protein [Mesorhizobium robiniae]|uniref:Oligopeptide/dipeptide ABC transporter ATP-binding protein n=1 Tax=Mesorhizobium robiniae TaxID=559315 RepID=A0ABV2GIY3_9HYPH